MAFPAIYRYICVGGKKLAVAIWKYLIEGLIDYVICSQFFQTEQFFITITEDEIDTGSPLIENKLDHTKCQRHIVQHRKTGTDIGGSNFGKILVKGFV